ncbi:MAG: cobalamin-dependent protein [Thermoleophilia bacterium]|nr:cobalamin-dependent protein [Thermoleophilia bacterium]
MAHELVEALVGMKEKEVLRIAEELLGRGEDPLEILRLSQEAMGIVGERYEEGEYFLPELVMSGEILKKVAALVKPRMAAGAPAAQKLGKVILGTVRGDIHDIGKDIVAFVLDVNGFEVTDLGINVPEEKFVEAVKANDAQVLALSGFLTLAFDSMKSTVAAVEGAGLRSNVRIIIGGGHMDETVRQFTGADAYGDDAMAAVTFAKQVVGVN